MLHYYKRLVRYVFAQTVTAFGLKAPRSLVLNVVLFVAAVVILRLFAGIDQVREEGNWALACLGAGVMLFAAVFLINLMAAPPRMESALRAEIDTAQESISALAETIRAKLAVSVDQPRLSPDGTRKWVRLHVTNEAHEQVRDCRGKLLEVKSLEQISVGLPDPEQNLMWSSRGGDAPDVRRSINPKSSEYLDVAFTGDFVDEYNAGRIQGTPELRARVQQLLDDPFRSHFNFAFVDYRSWPLPKGGYEVAVEVSAANVGTPTRICFRIVYEGGLNLYPEAFDTADSSPIED